MFHRLLRLALLLLNGLVGLTAVGGGLLLVTGADRFPREWLDGSPFGDYVLPGVILIAVGLSAVAAFVAVLLRPSVAGVASIVAGIVLVGWIAGEVVILQQNAAASSPRSATEPFYAVVGIAVALLGAMSLRPRREGWAR
jgi:hypothetical protein